MPLSDRLRSRTPRELREEREELGFVRRPEVRWLSPGLLARSGVEVIVSGTFGKFADKREIQREPQDGLDYSAAGELWVDYLSDTGDGFDATYTMAWLLAQESLDTGDERLPRAKVLLLGGDQVYPTADPVAYEDRFIGPFAAAMPKSDALDKPDLYALPGNHDWYDGLVSFLRVFCARDGRIGDWRTRQRRSYFALKMPNDWWVWGIDIQLDTYIDDVQLDYFRALAVKPGDKVVLLTAKPAWVKALPGRLDPASWRYLSYFEERVVRAGGARLVLTLTGDLHHYARYEPAGAAQAPTRITAGGGGAYLSPTHTLPAELQLRSLDHTEDQAVAYRRACVYPRAEDSSHLANGIVKLARLNPAFGRLLGAIYALLGAAMLGAVDSGAGSLVDAAGDRLDGFLAAAIGGMSLLVVVLLFGAIFGGTDIVPGALERNESTVRATKLGRLVVALLHTAGHVAVVSLVLWAVIENAGDHALVIWVVGLLALFVAGAVLGATLFGAVMLAVHRARGGKAPETANQVFTGQSIPDYKNLLRMRFAPDGSLTIYALGVDRAGRDWRYVGKDAPGPRFVPDGPPPAVRPIDDVLRYDADGRRVS
ncbi:MAG TPA: metallophosphoesterase [Solirubrobacteraceae bacterium]|nr:metallophosphoesterase [Solirubrobacteraceae bacterium]